MKQKLNSKAYLERELYIGFFGIILGIFLMFAPDRNTDLYIIYPRAVFAGIIAISAVMVLSTLFGGQSGSIKKARISPLEVLVLLIIVSARFLINTLGLFISVFLISTAISLLVNRDRSVKGLLNVLLFNVVLIAVLYLMFAVFLKVNAPKALFF